MKNALLVLHRSSLLSLTTFNYKIHRHHRCIESSKYITYSLTVTTGLPKLSAENCQPTEVFHWCSNGIKFVNYVIQTTQTVSGISSITVHYAYVSTNKSKIIQMKIKLFSSSKPVWPSGKALRLGW